MLPAFLWLVSGPFDSSNMSVLLRNGFGTEKVRAAGKAVNAQGLGLEPAPGNADRERMSLNFSKGFCADTCSAGWQPIGLCFVMTAIQKSGYLARKFYKVSVIFRRLPTTHCQVKNHSSF